ncbi:MAG: ketol-acid reductoisomerase [Abditibacteriota bacterium]|nr:ketol-acid reductoisomerase [Abditibacteriota bacterium]
MNAKIYYSNDIDDSCLKNRLIGILGYGNQGRSHALNLRDSGFRVIVANHSDTPNGRKAREDGFDPLPIPEAVKAADVVMLTLPDESMADIYAREIAPYLKEAQGIMFCHGFNVHFGKIIPPANTDVFMVAPKGAGYKVRAAYEKGGGVAALFAVRQNYTGAAADMAKAYAKGLGCGHSGILESSFEEECVCDLFGEQAVLCGGMAALIEAGFNTLVKAGYRPEVAYFECCHEVKIIMDLIYQKGISAMNKGISNTAEYGGYVVGKKIINSAAEKIMDEVLKDIQTGKFADAFLADIKKDDNLLTKTRKANDEALIEKTGAFLREKMNLGKD